MKRLGERLKSQTPCPFGLDETCCRNCLLGPCRITSTAKRGVCGAEKEVIVARGLTRFVAGGAAAHCGHAYHLLEFLKKKYPENYIKKRAPSYLYKTWKKLGIVPEVHLEHFKDISEALHATTMGVDADYQDILKWAMRLGIIDGYYGMYLATELEDKEFGSPEIKEGALDLGVISNDKVNIAVHGHELQLASALAEEAKKYKEVNLVGVCCTGAAILARYGVPLAANFVLSEDVIATGAIEAMAVDVQCIMPSLVDLAECYHTKLITTNELGKIPGALHLPVTDEKSAKAVAKRIIKTALENFKNRRKVNIPATKTKIKVGFTPDNLDLKELFLKIKKKEIKGIIGAIGCNNPRVTEDWVSFYKKMSDLGYIILTTGCIAFKLGQAGLLDGERFFHLGSCVNNARIAEVFRRIANLSNKQITDLPFLISCPAPMTEKAIAIGFFFASLGVDVHFGYSNMFNSEPKVTNFLANILHEDFKSKIFLETSPLKLLEKIKKEGLSLDR